MKNYLPAAILCREPFVIGGFFEDFIWKLSGFKKWAEGNPDKAENAHAIFMFGYHYETSERVTRIKGEIAEVRKLFPTLNMHFLCNSPLECENLKSIGEDAIFCSQNAFLNFRRYWVIPVAKKYEALYLARFTPIKRHALAMEIPHLLLIGDYSQREADYAKSVLAKRRSDSNWIRKVQGIFVPYYMNQARCGLCLSPEEGAMYASAEYGLCGLPVLTCECLGGREYSLSEKYVMKVSRNPTPEEVAEGVKELNAKNYKPRDVRAASIEVLQAHRERYKQLCLEIFEKNGGKNCADLKMLLNVPHKMGVRCRVTPWFNYFRKLSVD